MVTWQEPCTAQLNKETGLEWIFGTYMRKRGWLPQTPLALSGGSLESLSRDTGRQINAAGTNHPGHQRLQSVGIDEVHPPQIYT